MDWFLYDRDLRHERVKAIILGNVKKRRWLNLEFASPHKKFYSLVFLLADSNALQSFLDAK